MAEADRMAVAVVDHMVAWLSAGRVAGLGHTAGVGSVGHSRSSLVLFGVGARHLWVGTGPHSYRQVALK